VVTWADNPQTDSRRYELSLQYANYGMGSCGARDSNSVEQYHIKCLVVCDRPSDQLHLNSLLCGITAFQVE